jgi:hypothetical protein
METLIDNKKTAKAAKAPKAPKAAKAAKATNVAIAKDSNEIDFQGQLPYCELPFNMDTINNFQKYRTLILVFEGIEGSKKKFKYIRINEPMKFKDGTEDWDSRKWPSDIILKRLLFLLYLGIWANIENIVERAKKQLKEDKKVNKFVFELIVRDTNKLITENYSELKLILQKLIDKKINRVYIVYQTVSNIYQEDGTNFDGPDIKGNLESKGYTEWDLDDGKKDVDINTLATKYFSLDKIKNLREEGLVYIKQLETKYNKELEEEKKAEEQDKLQKNSVVSETATSTTGGRRRPIKRK